MKRYEYDAILHETVDNGGSYVVFPFDIRQEFGKGRVKVHATFEGIPYDGSIVNMGLKNEDGSVCYIIGVLKKIRNQLNIVAGDSLHTPDNVSYGSNKLYWWKGTCGHEWQTSAKARYCGEKCPICSNADRGSLVLLEFTGKETDQPAPQIYRANRAA